MRARLTHAARSDPLMPLDESGQLSPKSPCAVKLQTQELHGLGQAATIFYTSVHKEISTSIESEF